MLPTWDGVATNTGENEMTNGDKVIATFSRRIGGGRTEQVNVSAVVISVAAKTVQITTDAGHTARLPRECVRAA